MAREKFDIDIELAKLQAKIGESQARFFGGMALCITTIAALTFVIASA